MKRTLARAAAACATAAPPTQLLSRECTGPSNSERESEQKKRDLGESRGEGKERERERKKEGGGGAVEH